MTGTSRGLGRCFIMGRSEGREISGVMRGMGLNSYVDYEMEYVTKELKLVTTNLKREWIDIHGRKFLLWEYEVPKQKVKGGEDVSDQAKAQLYVSTIWYDQVLDISSPVLQDMKEGDARTFVFAIAATLTSYEGELDMDGFYKKLNGGK